MPASYPGRALSPKAPAHCSQPLPIEQFLSGCIRARLTLDWVKSNRSCKSEVAFCNTCSVCVVPQGTDTVRWPSNRSVVAAGPISVWPLAGIGPAATASRFIRLRLQ